MTSHLPMGRGREKSCTSHMYLAWKSTSTQWGSIQGLQKPLPLRVSSPRSPLLKFKYTHDGVDYMTVWSVQGGSMGVLPGHVADNLQCSGASSGPDEGLEMKLFMSFCRHWMSLHAVNVIVVLIYSWVFTVYLSATLLLQLHELFLLKFCEFKSSLSQQKNSRLEQSMCVVLNLTTLSSTNSYFHGNLVYIKLLMILRESPAAFCPTSTHHPWPLWLVSHRTSLHQSTGATSITPPQPVSHVTGTFSHTWWVKRRKMKMFVIILFHSQWSCLGSSVRVWGRSAVFVLIWSVLPLLVSGR